MDDNLRDAIIFIWMIVGVVALLYLYNQETSWKPCCDSCYLMFDTACFAHCKECPNAFNTSIPPHNHREDYCESTWWNSDWVNTSNVVYVDPGEVVSINVYDKPIDGWECVEWENTIQVNPVWMENCCVNLTTNLTDYNTSTTFNISIEREEVEVKLTKNRKYTTYEGGCFCIEFDGMEVYSSLTLLNQNINISKCIDTPKIVRGEPKCITKRRVN